jgi:general L-amino acid transport system permease protein
MDTIITDTLAVPPPEPERPPADGPLDWLRRNMFRSPVDGIVSVVAGIVVGFVIYRFAKYVFVTARWEIIRANLKLFMVGNFPSDELWRIALALALTAAFTGLAAGFIHRRRQLTGIADPFGTKTPAQRVLGTVGRLWPLIVGVGLILSLVRTEGPWIVVAVIVVAGVLGRLAGPHLPARSGPYLVIVAAVGFAVLLYVLNRSLPLSEWGGVMLNVLLAVAGITLCFPLGVLLALGRRSKLPLIRWLCTIYIEVFRGVPLYVLLFLPSATANPSIVSRAIAAMTLFTAAYIAEIVRGGLQSLPRGQTEAAQALGLSPVKTTFLIVLPQALRNVIPAIVGQFISLFKDTTLAAAAMPLFDLLTVNEIATAQSAFQGKGLTGDALAFVMLVFWMGCITMSRESQRLEKRLGVGTR